MPHRTIPFIKFIGDISGVPKKSKLTNDYENVIIAVVSINKHTIQDDLQQIKKTFPEYWDKKGHQLTSAQLTNLLELFNHIGFKIATVNFDIDDWNKYKTKYCDETDLEEKIMSILYFYAIKHFARNNLPYDVILDNDTCFGIHQSIVLCKRLAKMCNYNFEITFGHRDINYELRIPDWVAQARRKIDLEILQKYDNFHILKNKLPWIYLSKVSKS